MESIIRLDIDLSQSFITKQRSWPPHRDFVLGPSKKNVRSQGEGVCPLQTRGEGVLPMRTPAFFGAKNFGFF